MLRDLRARSAGVRESGAFLLGSRTPGLRRIEAYLLFDEIDPNALTGWIDFDGSRMDLVWEECRKRDLSVVADVHTHPGGHGQSQIDRDNPMMPRRGHVALIVPEYARCNSGPGSIGIYELMGPATWVDHSRAGTDYFSLEWL